MRQLVLIAHNLRSSHNVGSLMRTADGMAVMTLWLTGYTPYPALASGDTRLPYLADKIERQIHKTALGAEKTVDWQVSEDIQAVISDLKSKGFVVIALEQTKDSLLLPEYTKPPEKIALVVGREVEGLEQTVIKACDLAIEIPMLGKKESFNVSIAAAIALYALRYTLV